MCEGDRTVMRVALLDQHVAVEAAHLRDREDADAAEAAGGHRKDFAFRDVGAQVTVGVALQAVEGDLGRSDIALERAAGEVRFAAVFQQAVLDQLILDGPVGAHLAGRGVAAVEAHEGVGEDIGELAGDLSVEELLRDTVVDVQQRDGVIGHAGAHVFGQGAVDIHFAAHRNAAGGQAGVDVAGFEAELLREGRPALVGKGHELAGALVRFRPVQQGQFKLRHAREHIRVAVAADAQFLRHIIADGGDAFVTGVFFVGDEEVQFTVLFHFHAQFIEALDRGVAGEEVLRARTEGDHLQSLQAQDTAGDRDEFADHLSAFFSRSHRVGGDVGAEMAHTQVVGAVQHTAVGVAASVDQVAVAFGSRDAHRRTVEFLDQQRFRGLGAEVAEVDHQRVAAGLLHVFQRLQGVGFVFNGNGTGVKPFAVGFCNGSAAAFGEPDRETVAGDSDQSEFDIRDIVHHGKKTFFL